MPWKRESTEQDEQVPEGETLSGSEASGTDAGSAAGETQERDEAAEWRDRYLRAAADMDNVRRRARQDAEDARKFANERLLSDLLPVLDNFARALEAAQQTPDFDALRTGVEMIHRQLDEVLTRTGLERIEALNQPFDPNLHEAIMQVEPQEGQEPHQVVQELRAGYRLNDRVVRPTLVKVTSG